MTVPTPLENFITERNAALSSLDMAWARRVLPFASCDDVRLVAMHKSRYECTDIAPELRHSSADWLRRNDLLRMDGSALLPEGELPRGVQKTTERTSP